MTNTARRTPEDYVAIAIVTLAVTLIVSVVSCKPAQAQDGFASYYTKASCKREGTSGVYTASGEPYNEGALTCALPWKPNDRMWAVYGHRTGHTVFVRHNDKGPGKGPQSKGVIIDLTPEAFKQVCGSLEQGKCEVSIQGVI